MTTLVFEIVPQKTIRVIVTALFTTGYTLRAVHELKVSGAGGGANNELFRLVQIVDQPVIEIEMCLNNRRGGKGKPLVQ